MDKILASHRRQVGDFEVVDVVDEAEIARLTAEFHVELNAKKGELLEIQEAYDQFEQQSDQILNELDQQNERLRIECKSHNSRSML